MADRDWWPFTRLLITASVLTAAAHVWFGWTPDARHLLSVPSQMLGVLSLLAMISFVLADLYLLVFLAPLYGVAVLNDWFYGVGRWVGGHVFGVESKALLAVSGLVGEVLLFGALVLLVSSLVL